MKVADFIKSPLRIELMDRALEVLKKAYTIPVEDRPRLTHEWLALQLGVTKGLAFPLLITLVKSGRYCKKYPSGQIYWADYVLTPEQAALSKVPRSLNKRVVTFILLSSTQLPALKKVGIKPTLNTGWLKTIVENKPVEGYCLRIVTNDDKYNNLLVVVGSIPVTTDPVLGSWTFTQGVVK